MLRKTQTILAIAFTATACGGGTAVTHTQEQDLQSLNQELSTVPLPTALAETEHFRPLCDAKGYPLVGNINSKEGTTATAFCAEIRKTPPLAPPGLDKLNAELGDLLLDDALAQRDHFRPLCDDKGYPLVGNINGKVITTASQFCKALRDRNEL